MSQQKPVRDAGVLLAVRMGSGDPDEAAQARSAGARDVKPATGRRIDFDPPVPPVPVDVAGRDAGNSAAHSAAHSG
jgi:hypothetical protein